MQSLLLLQSMIEDVLVVREDWTLLNCSCPAKQATQVDLGLGRTSSRDGRGGGGEDGFLWVLQAGNVGLGISFGGSRTEKAREEFSVFQSESFSFSRPVIFVGRLNGRMVLGLVTRGLG